MDGIAGVQARIAQIEGFRRLTQPAPAPAPTAGGSTAAEFARLLDTSIRATGGAGAAAPATAAQRLAPGAYGPLAPPAELAQFGNGQIPADALASIGGGHRLERSAAAAFEQLRSEAQRAGITVGVTDSYRDLATQQDLVARKGLYSNGGLAAAPGTSTHGWGLSLDLDLNPAAQEWMRTNAHRFGFVEDVPREPWHWTYRPA